MSTPGRRVHGFDGPHELLSSEYGRWHGVWHAVTPDGLAVYLGHHDITEHADGTISVGGAITANDGTGGHRWTGTLDHGAWREC